MVLIPISWRTYTSTAAQRAIKRVACEKCGCQFAYQMIRCYSHSGHSVYGLDNQGARQRAVGGAAQKVASAITHHEDPVACPQCGWFQQSMVTKNLRRTWSWTPWGSGSNIDPNRDYPHKLGHFPGMPTAVRVQAGTNVPVEPVPLQHPPDIEPGGAITLRLTGDRLPTCCCMCLGPSQSGFRAGNFLVPVCLPCKQKASRIRFFKALKWISLPGLILLPLAILAALILRLTVSSTAPLGTFLFVTFMVLFLVAFLSAGAGMLLWIWLRGSEGLMAEAISGDAISLTCRIRFENPQYAQRVQQAIARTVVDWALPQEAPLSFGQS
jgi:hypothetical protein